MICCTVFQSHNEFGLVSTFNDLSSCLRLSNVNDNTDKYMALQKHLRLATSENSLLVDCIINNENEWIGDSEPWMNEAVSPVSAISKSGTTQ